MPEYSTVRISRALFEACGRSGHWVEAAAWETINRRQAEAEAAEAEPEPKPEPQPQRNGTLIVAELRTRCPECGGHVEVGDSAVMMDWRPTPDAPWRSKAFHLGCAHALGFRRAA